jgi:hypothetical protein
MSETLISNGQYAQITADFTDQNNNNINEYQNTADLIISNEGINSLSVIFELFNDQGEEVPFSNQKYRIYVSHTAGDYFQKDLQYDYYHQVVLDPNKDWILLRSVPLGNAVRCTNSWTENNQINSGQILHFKFCRFSIDKISNCKIRMTASSR